MLSLHGPTPDVRLASIALLADRAEKLRKQVLGRRPDDIRHKVLKGWKEDLVAIAAQSEEEGSTMARGVLTSRRDLEKVDALIKAAKGGKNPSTISASNSLFHEIDQRLKDKQPRLRNYISHAEVANYVECTAAAGRVNELLDDKGICVVCGPGGSGKTTLAVHEASRDDQQVVTRFVPADAREKLLGAFQEMANDLNIVLAQEQGGDLREYHRKLSCAIYDALQKSGQRLFLILDDAQDAELVRDCDLHGRDKDRIKIIVTTKNPTEFLGYCNNVDVRVELTGFSEEEGKAYVAQRLNSIRDDRYLPDEQALKELTKGVGLTPMKLELATAYIRKNSLCTVETYLAALRSAAPGPEVIPEVNIGLGSLGSLSQQVMRYSTWLDADFIPVSLLKAILENANQGKLQEILTPLESLSLVKTTPNKHGTGPGIQILQDVQRSCAHYSKWVEETNIDESKLLGRLVEELTRVIKPSSTPNEGEEVRRQYLQHVMSVLTSSRRLWASDETVVLPLVRLLITYAGPTWEAQRNSVVWDALLPHGRALFAAIGEEGLSQAEKEGRYQLARYLAYACHVTARFEEGNVWAQKCLDIAKGIYGAQNHPEVAHALRSCGISLVELGKDKEALEYKEKALEMQRSLCKEDKANEDVVRALSDVANSCSQLGRYKEALAHQKEVLKIREELCKGDHPEKAHTLNEKAHTLNSIGELLSHLGEYEKALQSKQKSLEMRRSLFQDQDHPDIRRSLTSVGIGYEQVGKLKEALECKREALEMSRRLYKDGKHPDIAHSLNNLGETLIKQGKLEEGLGELKEALAMRKKIYGDSNQYTAYSLNSVGRALALLGRRKLKMSLVHCRKALNSLNTVYPEQDHAYKVQALRQLSESLKQLGNLERGEQCSQTAFEMEERLAATHSR